MADIKVKVKGLKEVDRALAAMPAKLAKRIASKSMRVGAKILLQAAKQSVPVGSGVLKRSLAISVKKRRKTALSYDAFVYPRKSYMTYSRKSRKKTKRYVKNDGWYAHFSEFGTARGMTAQRWLEKSYKRSRTNALNAFADDVKRRVKEIIV